MANPLTRERAHLPLNDRVLMLEADVSRLQSDAADILGELKTMNGKIEKMQNNIYMVMGAVSAVTWIIQLVKH